MADRLLPHVQAYENSGLARFGIGQGYRPEPYVPQNFAPPTLAPKKFFGADLPTPAAPESGMPIQQAGMPIQQAGNGAAGPNGEGQNPEGMPGATPSLGQTAAAMTGLPGLLGAIASLSNQPSLMGPVAPTPSQLAQQNVDAQIAQDQVDSENMAVAAAQDTPTPSTDTQGMAPEGGNTATGNDGTGGIGNSAGSEGGGASGGGGGAKIICTAMNDFYGLPYRENKVWIAYAEKKLTPAHQRGYHKVFLPLVRYAYKSGEGWTNRALRSVLHWIAVERTKDLQDEIAGRNPRPIKRALLRKPAEQLLAWLGRT